VTARRALAPCAPRPDQAPRSERVAQIVQAARGILESEGADALTMRRISDQLGIKAPSLYKHLPGREAVVAHLINDVLFESGDALHAAVSLPTPDGPVTALLDAYRDFGRRHPNLYRLTTAGDLDRIALSTGLETWAGEPFYRATGDPYRAQALWAFAHGTLILEIDGRFMPGSDLDQTWRAGAAAFGRRPHNARSVDPAGRD
jgi:AcrR family transcriptional regulator